MYAGENASTCTRSKIRIPMPIVPHTACTEPEPDTIVCRFMDLPKFRDLFANEELYFRRTDLFKEIDPEEALPSAEYVRETHGLLPYDLNDELTLNENLAFARQMSESHYIQCWQIFEGETLDMWARYANGNGVAIFSRFDILKSALNAMLDEVMIGLVRYGNRPTRYNFINFLFMKGKHFDKERELRAVLTCYDPVGGANRHIDLDLKTLVSEIRVSPWATATEVDEVNDWMRGKNFSCPVNRSVLTGSLTPSFADYRR